MNLTGQKGTINKYAPHWHTHLYELNDVRVPQRPVVDDLAVHILVDLRKKK
jgi:hypothetical protein